MDYIIKYRKIKLLKFLEVIELLYLVIVNVFFVILVLGKILFFRIMLIDVEDGDCEKMYLLVSIFF